MHALEVELAAVKSELAEMKKKLPSSEFITYRGVKFRRKPSGSFEPSVYCPTCEVGMASVDSGSMPFVCGKCHSLSGFTAGELQTVLQELATEYPN